MLLIAIDHEAWECLAWYKRSLKLQLSRRTFNWIQVRSPSRDVHTTQFCHRAKLIKLKVDHCSAAACYRSEKFCYRQSDDFTELKCWIKKFSFLSMNFVYPP